ncbi:MAG: 23S rRNA (pseudouridine(1915)-N(3))-methyltransferase RlmH [Mollicutes bacterium PWAP]|nr:23S rRNA (pseudouridine(1915)-N(3))-methyltransferase RlmH [Mollicutes bacterium PWAP]
MNIKIICIGKLPDDLKKIEDKYKKRIKFYSKFEIIELKEKNNKNKKIQIKDETNDILKHISKSEKVFLFSLLGKNLSSVGFSKIFNQSNIAFIIGGSNGVDESLFKEKIKVSEMTFPHGLFRIMSLEQIFRSLNIKNGGKYHK